MRCPKCEGHRYIETAKVVEHKNGTVAAGPGEVEACYKCDGTGWIEDLTLFERLTYENT